ncbi:MAG: serine/threonine-protein kinase [Planctomycetota bacterium]
MRRLGAYEILEELGRGANGAVYRARHPAHGEVALKLLLGADVADPESLARFTLEAQIAQKLAHPGIVRVLDFGAHDGRPYLVMEFCPGTSLEQLLKPGPLPPQDSAELVSEVARAMAYAHRLGVIHRDLKPGNVIVDPQGRPRVTDFGLARDRSLRRSLTRSGDAIGTPVTMAPEQFADAKGVDHRADIYALGATLYRCLTGRYPHVSASMLQLVELVRHQRPPSPHELDPRIPRALSDVCMRALEKDPAERYADCAALAQALDQGGAAPAPQRAGSPRWVLAAGVGLGLLLALGVGGWRALEARRQARVAEALEGARAQAPSPAGAREALALLAAADAEAALEGEREAARAARRELSLRLLERARDPGTPWAARPELLELVPALDPERGTAARAESLLQAGLLAERLAQDPLAVDVGPELLRRLAAGDPALEARAHDFAAAARCAEALAAAVEAGRREPYPAARARLGALTLPPRHAEDVQLELARLAARRGRAREAVDLLRPLLRSAQRAADAKLQLLLLEWEHASWNDELYRGFAHLGREHPSARAGRVAAAFGSLHSRWGRAPARSPEEEARQRRELVEGGEAGAQIARDVLRDAPRCAEAWLALGLTLRQAGQTPEALDAFLRGAEVALDDARLYLALSETARRSRDLSPELQRAGLQARDRYLELTQDGEASRTRLRILESRASDALEAGSYTAAARDFDAVLQRRPFDARAQLERGIVAATLGTPAAEHWRIARAVCPEPGRRSVRTFQDLLDGIPERFAHLKPQIEAAVDFAAQAEARAQALAPEPAREALQVALRRASLGAPYAAVAEEVAKVRAAAPESAAVQLEAARILCGRDLLDAAREALEAARALGADPLEVARLEAERWLRLGRGPEAREALAALARRDPEGVRGRWAQAEAALLAQDFPRAAARAREALALEPDHVPSLVVLSLATAREEPHLATLFAARARAVERDLDARVLVALLVATLEGLARGERAWVPGHLVQQLQQLSPGPCWNVPVAFSAVEHGLTQALILQDTRVDPERADAQALLGTLLLHEAAASEDQVLRPWLEARAIDPGYVFPPEPRARCERRFPGAFERRIGPPR